MNARTPDGWDKMTILQKDRMLADALGLVECDHWVLENLGSAGGPIYVLGGFHPDDDPRSKGKCDHNGTCYPPYVGDPNNERRLGGPPNFMTYPEFTRQEIVKLGKDFSINYDPRDKMWDIAIWDIIPGCKHCGGPSHEVDAISEDYAEALALALLTVLEITNEQQTT